MPSNKKLLQAAAGSAGGDPLYVEDVFSTYLYDGNNTTNAIANSIDLSGEGGMVWLKCRNTGGDNNIYDTDRGVRKYVVSNSTAAESFIDSAGYGLTGFNNNGFTLEASWNNENASNNNNDYASWSFRKQAGFFDVVTYTGNGTGPRAIAHNLGCKPSCIIIKNLDQSYGWAVWVKSFDVNEYDSAYILLNTTDSSTYSGSPFVSQLNVGSRNPSANFYVKNNSLTNTNGIDYVAYLFADGDDSDAQIFGDDGDESIIKCGSYIGNGNSNGPEVNLGFEPQFLMVRNTTGGNWVIADTMRSFGLEDMASLYPNSTTAESTIIAGKGITPTATGFKCIDGNATTNQNSASHIYIAIRRPMKTPESGTEVFAIDSWTTGTPSWTSGFPVDFGIVKSTASAAWYQSDRLRGSTRLSSNTDDAEASDTFPVFDYQNGWGNLGADSTYKSWMFKRATGFMDVVAYKGSSSVYQKPHNLGVVPELMIVKNRGANETGWSVYTATTGADNRLQLNSTGASSATSDWDNASDVGVAPTATHFNVKANSVIVNSASYNYIAYLFATLAGVSKVGSYTGTGSNVNVDCGFSAGARFILIKRTNSTGDWYVWDTTRGIIAGNDPYLVLNTTAAEVTNTDYIDPLASGFTVTSSAPAALNASGGTYIFLAIA